MQQGQIHTHNSCSIVGLLGLFIQLILGFASFSILIIKRHFENPKRHWQVWCFDTLKQLISQLLAHFLNLTISVALNYHDPNSNTCLWYLVTNIFDNTVGVLISVLTLRRIEYILIKKNKLHLVSGHYYEIIQPKIQTEYPDFQQKIQLPQTTIVKTNYRSWLLQLMLWNLVFLTAKLIVFVLQYLLQGAIDKISHVLSWLQKYPDLELILVIVVVPVIMNAFAFWIVDNFLKKREISQQCETKDIQSNNEKQQGKCDKNQGENQQQNNQKL